MIKKLLVIFLFLQPAGASAQEKMLPTEHRPRERTYHVVHYRNEVSIAMKAKTLKGNLTVTLVPLRSELSSVLLDAAAMEIREVKKGKTPLRFTHTGDSLLIALDRPYGFRDTLRLTISYSVTSPPKGLYFVEADSSYPERDWCVWTQGEAEDNHYWFPCYDFPNDRATSEMICTVEDPYTAISNGRLLSVEKDAKTRQATYHWYEGKPHVSYLVSLIVGRYVNVKDAAGAVPISNYVFPREKDVAMLSFSKTPAMIRFYEQKTGYRYPWEKYAQTVVSDFIYGGEENVSATTLTDGTIHDARSHLDYTSDGLVAHELAHQWWGDLVSFRDWSHAWLSEGFATYFEVLFTEFDRGRDAAMAELTDNQRYLAGTDVGENRRATVSSRYVNPMDLFDNRIYGKGACILDMMRFTLGDEAFWKGIREYIGRHAFRSIETNDFRLAMEDATGKDLGWFFDEWVYRPGYPEFTVRSTWEKDESRLRLIVEQTQKTDSLTGLFRMPVDVEVTTGGVPKTYRVDLAGASDTFSFPASQAPDMVIFDKGSRLLKKVLFDKPAMEWLYQMAHAEYGVDRLAALSEVRAMVDSPAVAEAFMKAALEDRFDQLRRSAIWALGNSRTAGVKEALMKASGDPDASVRAAAVAGLGNFSDESVIRTLKKAFESDSSYSVVTSALHSLMSADSSRARTYCAQALTRDSWYEVIRAAALRSLAAIGDSEALSTIRAYTKAGIDRSLRLQSIRLLGDRWKANEEVVGSIATLLADQSRRVRRTVIDVLSRTGSEAALEPLQNALSKETDVQSRKQLEEAIESIRQGHK